MVRFCSLARRVAFSLVLLLAAVPAFAMEREILSQPSSPMWAGKSYMDSLGATGANRLHEIGITGYGVSAAVMDSPFDITHPAIRDNVLAGALTGISLVGKVQGFEYTAYSSDMTYYRTVNGQKYLKATGPNSVSVPGLTAQSQAEYGSTDMATYLKAFGGTVTATATRGGLHHGTHVAGTVTVMAPKAGLVLVNAGSWLERDPGLRNDKNLASFAAADMGLLHVAEIAEKYNIVAMNNSWGDATFAQFREREPEFEKAVNTLYDKGVAVVAASGNDSMNEVGRPANYDHAYSVGALKPDGMVAFFSDQPIEKYSGKENIMMAPGVAIVSSIAYTDASGEHRYRPMQGTSMASPHVTGAFTLLASGARNASLDELAQALFLSADIVPYDGNQILEPPKGVFEDIFPELRNIQAANPTIQLHVDNLDDPDIARSQDDWRELGRLRQLIVLGRNYHLEYGYPDAQSFVADMLANAEAKNILYPYLGPLGRVDFHYLRVDRAYQYLTSLRMGKRALEVQGKSDVASQMLAAYANELGSALRRESSQIFQRLDAQSASVLARVGRQMSPQWTASAIEQGMLGVVGVHRALGRRGDISRLSGLVNEACNSLPPVVAENAEQEARPAISGESAPGASRLGAGNLWVEGFGGGASRSGSMQRSGYSSHFAGSNLGFELRKGGFAYGLFGSIADYGASGSDGHSDGNWYNVGLYGRYDKKGFYGEASAAYTHASFDTSRHVDIPGAVFSTPYEGSFLRLPEESRRAKARNRMNGVSGRLAGGYDFEPGNDWYVGPRVEGAFVHGRVSAYQESGAGALNLSVDSFNQTYAETGAGLGAAYVYKRPNCGAIIASAKVMGMYGWSFGDDMTGKYKDQGSKFRISPKRHSGMWAVPEASLTWKVNERVGVSASYSGRFGKRYSENNGALSLNINF